MTDSFVAGQKLTAAFLNALLKGSAGWEPYTPSFVSPAVLGNGSLTGAYQRGAGRTVHYKLRLVWGSTTVGGAGAFQWTLPFVAADSGAAGNARLIDVSAGLQFYRHAFKNGGANIALAAEASGTFVQATVPFTFATGDTVDINGTYEALT